MLVQDTNLVLIVPTRRTVCVCGWVVEPLKCRASLLQCSGGLCVGCWDVCVCVCARLHEDSVLVHHRCPSLEGEGVASVHEVLQ